MVRQSSPIFVIVLTALIVFSEAWTQNEGANHEATIESYEATIASLQTRVAEKETSPPESGAGVGQDEPAATPSPSPVTDVGPMPIGDAFVVLYYYFAYDDGELAVYGEMENVSSVGQVAPGVEFTFFDDNGNSYGSDQAQPVSHWIEAGQRMPFHYFSLLGGAIAPGDWASVEVAVGNPASSYYIHDTSMLEIEEAPVEGPLQSVSGRIRNNGSAPVTGLSIYTAQYDEQGVFVGACTQFSPSSDAVVPPGGAIRFEAGGGSCSNTSKAKAERDSQGPFTQRLIIVRTE